MNLFSISDLSRFSGVKPHTIRVWEQRYHALKPQRSSGNTRYYDDLQLRRLLNIVSLLELDHKISEVASLNDDAIFNLLDKVQPLDPTDKHPARFYTLQLIKAGMNYDEVSFEKIFYHLLLHMGLKQTYVQVIYPLLEQVGLLWSRNKLPPSQEHFLTNLLRQKLCTAIDGLPVPGKDATKWMLFLPENEFHETGLLLASYLLRQSGNQPLYLGANVPLEAVLKAVDEVKPQNLLTFLVHNDSKVKAGTYIKQLVGKCKAQQLFIAGDSAQIKKIREKKVVWLTAADDLAQYLHM